MLVAAGAAGRCCSSGACASGCATPRSSSVEQVTRHGSHHRSDAERVRAALAAAARHDHAARARGPPASAAVAGFPVVRDVQVDAPTSRTAMTIRVIEHVPAAVAVTGGRRVPVAADGTVLAGPRRPPGRCRRSRSRRPLKAARGSPTPVALARARDAGAAPPPLRRRARSAHRGSRPRLVVTMRYGPRALLRRRRAGCDAKWAAAARRARRPDAQGATYVDVRVPGRPASAGWPPASPDPAEQTPASATRALAAPDRRATPTRARPRRR